MAEAVSWRETFDGGSREAERAIFDKLAEEIVAVQRANAGREGGPRPSRTFHAKPVAAVDDARLIVDERIPPDLRVGPYRPGAAFPATVRLSNANGLHRRDALPDMRGIALRLDLGGGVRQELLATSYPVSHARNARQFVRVARIGAGPKPLVVPRLLVAFGPAETFRILRNLGRAARPAASLALESYWSRGAILWGLAGPVRFRLSPLTPAASSATASRTDHDFLWIEFGTRLAEGDVRFTLLLQRFVSEASTPIEDGAVEWREEVSPFEPIATLVLPRRPFVNTRYSRTMVRIDDSAFNPWNTPEVFRPLGNLNRARAAVYRASAAGWQTPGAET